MTPEIAADTGTDMDTDIINIKIQDIEGIGPTTAKKLKEAALSQ